MSKYADLCERLSNIGGTAQVTAEEAAAAITQLERELDELQRANALNVASVFTALKERDAALKRVGELEELLDLCNRGAADRVRVMREGNEQLRAQRDRAIEESEKDFADIAELRTRCEALEAALNGLMSNPHLDLGDLVYNVRDQEGLGWDGPSVKAWGKAVKAAIAAREVPNE